MPLPPETTTLAVTSSGLSDLISSLFINLVCENSSLGSPFSIGAYPPELSQVSNEVGLMVIHFLLSFVFTVAKAFPA